jgi:hypothetical protein
MKKSPPARRRVLQGLSSPRRGFFSPEKISACPQACAADEPADAADLSFVLE